jgi:hypothetical protein
VASLASQIDYTALAGFALTLAGVVLGMLERRKTSLIATIDAMPEVAGVVAKPTEEGAHSRARYQAPRSRPPTARWQNHWCSERA